jgi:thymidylate synthase ThyX
VPTKRLVEEVRTDPAMPLELKQNKPGMQGGDPLGAAEQEAVRSLWLKAASNAADIAEAMLELNVAKEVLNRVLEPFMWVHGVITSTEWDNWFKLRDHEAAQPEIRALAQSMREAMDASTPTPLRHGEWHLPYIIEADRVMAEDRLSMEVQPYTILRHLSAARCARISYSPFDGDPSWEREVGRVDRLIAEGHWSPFEHQATPDEQDDGAWRQPGFHGNFNGWIQNRRLLEV